jgi:hypothetical protein
MLDRRRKPGRPVAPWSSGGPKCTADHLRAPRPGPHQDRRAVRRGPPSALELPGVHQRAGSLMIYVCGDMTLRKSVTRRWAYHWRDSEGDTGYLSANPRLATLRAQGLLPPMLADPVRACAGVQCAHLRVPPTFRQRESTTAQHVHRYDAKPSSKGQSRRQRSRDFTKYKPATEASGQQRDRRARRYQIRGRPGQRPVHHGLGHASR